MKESPENRLIALENRCQRLEADVSTLTGWVWAQGAALVTLAGELNPGARAEAFEGCLEQVRANGLRTTITDERLRLVDKAIEEIAANFHRALGSGAGFALGTSQ